ncbi:MAG: M48 family metalloprotease [Acidobacteriota bacterium]
MRRILVLFATAVSAWGQLQQFKPSRLNLYSPDQDVQMGKEAADEVRKTMQVVKDPEMNAFVQKIGARLTSSPRTKAFPFTFEIVNDPSINAFALPGGPMFINTGLLAVIDNESQLAGVMAHEMSHVTLRHGTNNVSKANLLQMGAAIGGAAASSKGLWGSIAATAGGLGAQSLVLRFSRDAEKQADLNGAQIMNDAGYNPNEMAIFFDKLNSEGKKNDGLVANIMADHPTPGRRVDYVQDQNKYLPKKQYFESDSGALPRVKMMAASLPPPPKAPAAATANGQAAASANPAEVRPSGQFKTFQGRDFSINYPANWDALAQPNSPTATIAPKAALIADAKGQTQMAYGFIVAYYFPQDGKPNLKRDTADLLKQIQGNNAGMQQTETAKSVKVAGQPATLTPLQSASPYGNNSREVDMLLTIARPDGLFYIMFIAPTTEWSAIRPSFDSVVSSLQLKN